MVLQFLIFLLFLCLLGLLIFLCVEVLRFDPDSLRPAIQQYLSDFLQAAVRLGKIESVNPGTGEIRIMGIEIREKKKDSLLLSAPLMSAGFRPLALLRRSVDFQRSVEHRFEPRVRYALNEDDALIGQINYSLFDDQVVNDASTDRRTFKSTLDWNHNLTRTWSVYAGALFEDRDIPGDKLKSSAAYGGRMGGRYDVTRTEAFKALVEIEHSKLHHRKAATDVNYTVSWAHELTPRTHFEAGLTDGRRTSFSGGRTSFRSRVPTLVLNYALTPLVNVSLHSLYERQKALRTLNGEYHRFWDLGLTLTWQIREQLKFNLFYDHRRSTSRDYTNRVLHLQLEGTF